MGLVIAPSRVPCVSLKGVGGVGASLTLGPAGGVKQRPLQSGHLDVTEIFSTQIHGSA